MPIDNADGTLRIEMPVGQEDNITDWCLGEFQSHYDNESITKDDIWEYLYGVMHSPDWRERYRHDLQRNLPRVPFAPDFEAFRIAGRKLLDLHIGYEIVPEHPVQCLVDGQPDEGGAQPDAYRIHRSMKWLKKTKQPADLTVLCINDRCQLVGIPMEAHDYQVSGYSPLQWAVKSLRRKNDKASGIIDDPNGWHVWADDAFELIRHLRRLTFISVHTARIINNLPPSLTESDESEPDISSGSTNPQKS